MSETLRNGRGRIRCFAQGCRSWATAWRKAYDERDNDWRVRPVCPLDDPRSPGLAGMEDESVSDA